MLIYTRADMKKAARNRLDGNWGTAIGALLLAMVIPSLIVFIFSYFMGLWFSLFSAYGFVGTASFLMRLSNLLWICFGVFISGPLSGGYYFFCLRLARGSEVKATTPFLCFSGGNYGRMTLAYFMRALFIALWALLFYIPGIIKFFSYAMMPYILMDHPELGWEEAITASRRMMNGYKGDLFMLYLSFIPWLLLVCATAGIALLYVGPYMEQTFVNFYRSLKEEYISVEQTIPGNERQ